MIDVASGDILAQGLSMPHSPRSHGGRLWVCESGTGTLGYIDPASGGYELVSETPGFARGLDFAGDLAFVGLSQVRDSGIFTGIPITARLKPEERTCGVGVIDLARHADCAGPIRGGRAGDLCRATAFRAAIPRDHQRERQAAGRLVRCARCSTGRRPGGAATAQCSGPVIAKGLSAMEDRPRSVVNLRQIGMA